MDNEDIWPNYRYTALHVATGTQHRRQTRDLAETERPLNRLQLLELLNRWNGQQPGIWQYWEGR